MWANLYRKLHVVYVYIYWRILRQLNWLHMSFRPERLTHRTSSRELLLLIRKIKDSFVTVPLIKLGGDIDGGYLVPNDLEGIDALFSPGTGNCVNFEIDIARLGIPIYMADASISSPPITGPSIHFVPKFIAPKSTGNQFITLEEWMQSCLPASNQLILQMDIEGAEWSVLENARSEILRCFRIMVIEFHGCEKILDQRFFSEIFETFEKILEDFDIVNIHPNNGDRAVSWGGGIAIPPKIELTFYRKRESRENSKARREFSYSQKNHINNPGYPQPNLNQFCNFLKQETTKPKAGP